jgi:hypothetical protein
VTILLCLLSPQHVPNLLSVHHFRPDHIVLVETAEMRKKGTATHFLRALHLGGLNYEGRHEIAPLETEDSLQAVRNALDSVCAKNPAAHWIANLTGGTKPMSIATYVFFKERRDRLVYTSIAKPDVFLDIDADTREVCHYRPTIEEFLAGYGFKYRKASKVVAEAEKRAEKWWECARQIGLRSPSVSLLPLPDHQRSQARSKGWTLEPGQLRSDDGSLLESISATFALAPTDCSGRLTKHAAEFLTGGWLEVFFWGLIKRHALALDCWDVRLGLDVGRFADSSGNEFDVAFMHNYELAMIECKTGSQGHDRDGDILYKVDAVSRQFRALRVRSYLATTSDNILDRNGQIKSTILDRAAIYGCRLLSARLIHQLASDPENVGLLQDTLFGRAGEV